MTLFNSFSSKFKRKLPSNSLDSSGGEGTFDASIDYPLAYGPSESIIAQWRAWLDAASSPPTCASDPFLLKSTFCMENAAKQLSQEPNVTTTSTNASVVTVGVGNGVQSFPLSVISSFGYRFIQHLPKTNTSQATLPTNATMDEFEERISRSSSSANSTVTSNFTAVSDEIANNSSSLDVALSEFEADMEFQNITDSASMCCSPYRLAGLSTSQSALVNVEVDGWLRIAAPGSANISSGEYGSQRIQTNRNLLMAIDQRYVRLWKRFEGYLMQMMEVDWRSSIMDSTILDESELPAISLTPMGEQLFAASSSVILRWVAPFDGPASEITATSLGLSPDTNLFPAMLHAVSSTLILTATSTEILLLSIDSANSVRITRRQPLPMAVGQTLRCAYDESSGDIVVASTDEWAAGYRLNATSRSIEQRFVVERQIFAAQSDGFGTDVAVSNGVAIVSVPNDASGYLLLLDMRTGAPLNNSGTTRSLLLPDGVKRCGQHLAARFRSESITSQSSMATGGKMTSDYMLIMVGCENSVVLLQQFITDSDPNEWLSPTVAAQFLTKSAGGARNGSDVAVLGDDLLLMTSSMPSRQSSINQNQTQVTEPAGVAHVTWCSVSQYRRNELVSESPHPAQLPFRCAACGSGERSSGGFGDSCRSCSNLICISSDSHFNLSIAHHDKLQSGGSYFVQIEAVAESGAVSRLNSSSFTYDLTPPVIGTVKDLTYSSLLLNSSATTDDANATASHFDGYYCPLSTCRNTSVLWQSSDAGIAVAFSGFRETESDIVMQQWAIGTTIGANDVMDWTDVGLTATSAAQAMSLRLAPVIYYSTIRSCNSVGLCSNASGSGVSVTHLPPIIDWVFDGLVAGVDVDAQQFTDAAFANYHATDPLGCPIREYEVAFTDSVPGDTHTLAPEEEAKLQFHHASTHQIFGLVNSKLDISHDAPLQQKEGSVYYACVRATNVAGIRSALRCSNGYAAGQQEQSMQPNQTVTTFMIDALDLSSNMAGSNSSLPNGKPAVVVVSIPTASVASNPNVQFSGQVLKPSDYGVTASNSSGYLRSGEEVVPADPVDFDGENLRFSNYSFTLNAINATTHSRISHFQFDAPINITIAYDVEALLQLDSSSGEHQAGADSLAPSLTLFDTTTRRWVLAKTTCPEPREWFDFDAKLYTVQVCHLTQFALAFTQMPLCVVQEFQPTTQLTVDDREADSIQFDASGSYVFGSSNGSWIASYSWSVLSVFPIPELRGAIQCPQYNVTSQSDRTARLQLSELGPCSYTVGLQMVNNIGTPGIPCTSVATITPLLRAFSNESALLQADVAGFAQLNGVDMMTSLLERSLEVDSSTPLRGPFWRWQWSEVVLVGDTWTPIGFVSDPSVVVTDILDPQAKVSLPLRTSAWRFRMVPISVISVNRNNQVYALINATAVAAGFVDIGFVHDDSIVKHSWNIVIIAVVVAVGVLLLLALALLARKKRLTSAQPQENIANSKVISQLTPPLSPPSDFMPIIPSQGQQGASPSPEIDRDLNETFKVEPSKAEESESSTVSSPRSAAVDSQSHDAAVVSLEGSPRLALRILPTVLPHKPPYRLPALQPQVLLSPESIAASPNALTEVSIESFEWERESHQTGGHARGRLSQVADSSYLPQPTVASPAGPLIASPDRAQWAEPIEWVRQAYDVARSKRQDVSNKRALVSQLPRAAPDNE